jgi:hypothetical protein
MLSCAGVSLETSLRSRRTDHQLMEEISFALPHPNLVYNVQEVPVSVYTRA